MVPQAQTSSILSSLENTFNFCSRTKVLWGMQWLSLGLFMSIFTVAGPQRKKFKKAETNGKVIHVHNLIKMPILSKVVCGFNAKNPVKISMTYFAEVEKPILKLVWNLKGLWVPKTLLKKNKVGGLHFLISKLTTKQSK